MYKNINSIYLQKAKCCVCERERERERKSMREREKGVLGKCLVHVHLQNQSRIAKIYIVSSDLYHIEIDMFRALLLCASFMGNRYRASSHQGVVAPWL